MSYFNNFMNKKECGEHGEGGRGLNGNGKYKILKIKTSKIF